MKAFAKILIKTDTKEESVLVKKLLDSVIYTSKGDEKIKILADYGEPDETKTGWSVRGTIAIFDDDLRKEKAAIFRRAAADYAELADRADAHNCYAETHYDDEGRLRCSSCDRTLSNTPA